MGYQTQLFNTEQNKNADETVDQKQSVLVEVSKDDGTNQATFREDA